MKTAKILFPLIKCSTLLFFLVLFTKCTQQPNCSNSVFTTPNIQCSTTNSTFTDPRDNIEYKTITFCNQTWFAEDLRYQFPNLLFHTIIDSSYQDTLSMKCTTYFDSTNQIINYQYNWAASKYACPNGWHLPSTHEWHELLLNIGMNPLDTMDLNIHIACPLASYLMSSHSWDQPLGNNQTGFNVLGPNMASYWSSFENEVKYIPNFGFYLSGFKYAFFDGQEYIRRFFLENDISYNTFGRCRCIQD